MSKKAKKTAVEIVKPTRRWLLDHSRIFMPEYVYWDVEINKQWPLFIPTFFFNEEKKNVIRGLKCLLREYALSWYKVTTEKEQVKPFDNGAFQRHLVDLIPDADISEKANDLLSGKEIKIECTFNNSRLFLDRAGDSLVITIDPDTHITGIKALQSMENIITKIMPFFKQMSCIVKLPVIFGNEINGSVAFDNLQRVLEHIDWLPSVDILESYTNCSVIKAGDKHGVDILVVLKHHDQYNSDKDSVDSNNYRYPSDAKTWRRGNVHTKGSNFYFSDQRDLVMEFIFKSSVPDHSFGDKISFDFSSSEEQLLMRQLWAMTYFHLSQWACARRR